EPGLRHDRGPDRLRHEHHGHVPKSCNVRRPDLEGRQTGRIADRAGVQVRHGHQLEDGENPRAQDSAIGTQSRQRDHRMTSPALKIFAPTATLTRASRTRNMLTPYVGSTCLPASKTPRTRYTRNGS